MAVHFASPPYTSERAEQKVVALLEEGRRSTPGRMDMYHRAVHRKFRRKSETTAPRSCATVIMRRLDDASRRAHRDASAYCSALITGESLGQVASQTIRRHRLHRRRVRMMPVFPSAHRHATRRKSCRLAHRQIDTYDISIDAV